MIFVFAEDGGLEILPDAKDAQGSYEGIDVESGVFQFFYAESTALNSVFTVPNETGKFLGIGKAHSNDYRLVSGEIPDQDSFALCLQEAQYLKPNPWFESLEQVKFELLNEMLTK